MGVARAPLISLHPNGEITKKNKKIIAHLYKREHQMAPLIMTPDKCPDIDFTQMDSDQQRSRRLLSKAIKQICERKVESAKLSNEAKPIACRRGFSEPICSKAQPVSNFNRRKNKKGLSLTI